MSNTDLVIRLSADMAELRNQLGQAVSVTENAVSKIDGITGGLASNVKRSLAGIAAGFTVVSLADGVRSAISSLAKLDDAAEKTGASVEKLSALFKVAKISGIDTSLVEASLVKLSVTIAKAGDSGSEAAKGLKALGLAQSDLAGKDTAEALKLVADRMNQYADGSGKTALAVALLGKSGAEALPYLKDLAEVQELVGATSAKTAADAELFEKNMRKIGSASSILAKQLAAEALPALINFLEQFLEGRKIAGGFLSAIWEFGVLSDPFKNLDESLTSTRAEIEKNRIALAQYLAENKEGAGHDVSGDEARIALMQRRLEMLKLQQRQQALANSGPANYDARDYQAQYKAPVNFSASDKEEKDKAAKERLRLLSEQSKGEIDLIKLAEGDKLDIISHSEKMGTLTLAQAWEERQAATQAGVTAEIASLNKLLAAQSKDPKGQEETKRKIADANHRLEKSIREGTQAVELFNHALANTNYDNWLKSLAAIDSVTSGMVNQTQSLQEQIKYFGKTDQEILNTKASLLELQAAQKSGLFSDSAEVDALKDQAKAYRDLADASSQVQKLKESSQAWNEFTSDAGKSLSDAFRSAFEDVNHFASNFAHSLEKSFKEMVLKPSVNFSVNKSGELIGEGINYATNGLSGGGNVFGPAGSTILSKGYDYAYTSAAEYFGINSGGYTASAGGSAVGEGVASVPGGYTSTAASSSSAATAIPYIGWAIAGMALANSLSKQGYGYGGGQYEGVNDRTAGLSRYGMSNMLSHDSRALGMSDRLADILSASPLDNNVVAGIFGGRQKLTGQGLSANVQDGKLISAGTWADQKTTGGIFHSSSTERKRGEVTEDTRLALQEFITSINSTLVDDLNKTLGTALTTNINYDHEAEFFTAEVKHQLLSGLKDSDFGSAFPDYFKGLRLKIADGLVANSDDEKLYDAALQNIGAFISGLQGVASALDGINIKATSKDLYAIAKTGVNPAGLAQSISAYHEAFFTEVEKAETKSRQLKDAWASTGLSEALPETKEQFRHLVEGLDLSNEAGRGVFATLMQLSPAFADLHKELVDTGEATKKLTEDAANAKASLLSQYSAPLTLADAQQAFKDKGYNLDSNIVDQTPEALKKMAADLVKTFDQTTESGRDLITTAKELSPAWNAVIAESQRLHDAVNTRKADLAKSFASIENGLISSYQNQLSESQNKQTFFADIAKSLSSFKTSLLGGNLSPLSPLQKYEDAKARFNETSKKAALGDKDAMGSLQEVSQDFLQASRDYNASGMNYAKDFGDVQRALVNAESVANRQVSLAQMQVDALKSNLAALQGVQDNTATIASLLEKYLAGTVQNISAGIKTDPAKLAVAASGIDPEKTTTLSDGSKTYRSTGGAVGYQAVGAPDYELYSKNGIDHMNGTDLRSYITSMINREDYAGLVNAAITHGVSSTTMDAVMGWSAGTALDAAEKLKLPKFASGGVAQGLFLAGENGPELVYSGSPVNVLNANKTSAAMDNTPIVAMLNALLVSSESNRTKTELQLAQALRRLEAVESEMRLRNAA